MKFLGKGLGNRLEKITKVIPSFFSALESSMALSLSLAFCPIRICCLFFLFPFFDHRNNNGYLHSLVVGRPSGATCARGCRRFSSSGLQACCWEGRKEEEEELGGEWGGGGRGEEEEPEEEEEKEEEVEEEQEEEMGFRASSKPPTKLSSPLRCCKFA